ncbi:response regulator transcription factor [Clostridium novyi]|uniref:response regulator transcription factor n=1 Tax=Clostridium novyi TaxID=1542 RepID=UPI00068C5A6F|nr:response regulator [Clostridium novyi]
MFKILIADDERLKRESLKIMIEGVGNIFEVREAINGKEAIEIYKEFKPDIVLLDIKMPILSGIEVEELIKKEDKNKYIVIITAYDDFEKVKNALVLGIDEFSCIKP